MDANSARDAGTRPAGFARAASGRKRSVNADKGRPTKRSIDLTRALAEGTVAIDGVEPTFHGEIDALISADTPKCVLEKSSKVGRLFEDYETVERACYQRTGIFPIMHTVVVDRKLAAERPDLVKAIYAAFCRAKARTVDEYARGLTFNNMSLMLPWLSPLISTNRALLGNDWWPYGIAANRKSLDTYLRYHHEQGLSTRLMTCEELFVPELLDT